MAPPVGVRFQRFLGRIKNALSQKIFIAPCIVFGSKLLGVSCYTSGNSAGKERKACVIGERAPERVCVCMGLSNTLVRENGHMRCGIPSRWAK